MHIPDSATQTQLNPTWSRYSQNVRKFNPYAQRRI